MKAWSVLFALFLPACSAVLGFEEASFDEGSRRAERSIDSSVLDVSASSSDAGLGDDASSFAPDAFMDAALDVGVEAFTETSAEASPDAPADSASDSAPDSPVDSPSDSPVDSPPDSPPDAPDAYSAPVHCADGIFQSATESDVDCGGQCPRCGANAKCNTGADCVSGACLAGRCQ